MSTFAVTVCPITNLIHHPNADALDLATISGFTCVVGRDSFKVGDLVAYIPENAVLPEKLIEEMGLTGRLSGPKHNRVKAVRLRGVLSQGLVHPARPEWTLGQNVASILGIEKFEPILPAQLHGIIQNVSGNRTIGYDIENWRKFQHVLKDGEEVVFTEKLHGTWVQFGVMPESLRLEDGTRLVVSSKGLAQRGLAFKITPEQQKTNLYLRKAVASDIQHRIERVFFADLLEGRPVFVLGEIFGHGVQDLGYGTHPDLRVFDIYVGIPGHGHFLSNTALEGSIKLMDNWNEEAWVSDDVIQRVPVLYRGPFSVEKMHEFTNGKETISGKSAHIREGIVMRPVGERTEPGDPVLGTLPCGGRVQLKSVSEAYLLRKGETTEFQ